MEGISFVQKGGCNLITIENFSDSLKIAIRNELSAICHGQDQAFSKKSMFGYKATLIEFLNRYDNKPRNTKIGMIGELLTHVIVIEMLTDFQPVSAYFNLEERSIKKGFDILLFSEDKNLWITEVKSGELHKGKNNTETTIELLNTAKRDLDARLNENNMNHWLNARVSANVAISGKKDYKDAVLELIEDEGDLTYSGDSTSEDNNVVLVSSLFSKEEDLLDENKLTNYLANLAGQSVFKDEMILCMKKSTYQKIEDFIREEAENA